MVLMTCLYRPAIAMATCILACSASGAQATGEKTTVADQVGVLWEVDPQRLLEEEQAIAAETPLECIQRLALGDVSLRLQAGPGPELYEAVAKLPRVAKILAAAESGSEDERQQLVKALKSSADKYCNLVEARRAQGGSAAAGLIAQMDSTEMIAYPMLLLRTGADEKYVLAYCARLNRHIQEVYAAFGDRLVNNQVAVCAYVADGILRDNLDHLAKPTARYTSEESVVLKEYSAWRERDAQLRGTTTASDAERRGTAETDASVEAMFPIHFAQPILDLAGRYSHLRAR